MSQILPAHHVATQDKDQQEQKRCHGHGHGHARAGSERLDGVLVGEDGVHPRGTTRTAAGQQVRQGEAVEGEDRRQQHGDDDDVAQTRQRDVQEASPGTRAVHRRGLVHLAVNRLESRQEQDDEKRDTRPHVDGDHRRQSSPRVGQPRWAFGHHVQDVDQQVIERTEQRVEQNAPGQSPNDLGNDVRQQDNAAQDRPPTRQIVKQQRHAQPDGELEDF